MYFKVTHNLSSIGREIEFRSNAVSPKINSQLYLEKADQQEALFAGILK